MTASILIVEDDPELAGLMLDFLKQHDYDVSHCERGDKALYRITHQNPDLVILDIMLPGVDGTQVCRSVRQHYQGSIVMLTAREDDESHLEGLNVGADDYLQKPIDPKILLARIELHLKRGRMKNNSLNEISIGQLHINQSSQSVTLNNELVELPPKEFELLCLLAINAGHILSRDNIYQVLRGIEYDGFDRGVDLQVSHLRKKLGDDAQKPFRLKTVWGKGYLLVPDAWE